MLSSSTPIVCIMGPTASGKTDLAIKLTQNFPFKIISVDSAMVYKGMDIGTAKPSPHVLEQAPHRMIDLQEPSEPFSAGQFRTQALAEIAAIQSDGSLPLLVGGTMMYFRILQQGLSALPVANPAIRQRLSNVIKTQGLPTLYAQLQSIDSSSAADIKSNDSQRIQRALEVYEITGKPLSAHHLDSTTPGINHEYLNIGLMPSDRGRLHAEIRDRFMAMLDLGFIAEVEKLYQREELHAELPSMRSIAYAQAWDYLAGNIDYETMCEQAIIATRQLAKRQMTWLRTWPQINLFDPYATDLYEQVHGFLAEKIKY